MNAWRGITVLALSALAACTADRPAQTTVRSTTHSMAAAPDDAAGSVNDVPFSVFTATLLQGRSFAEVENEIQRRIAPCMQAKGFRYVPVPYGTTEQGGDVAVSWRERKAQLLTNGYGSERNATHPRDPNEAYVASLSEASQQAFAHGLVGNERGGSGPDPESCRSKAESAVYSQIPYFQPAYSTYTSEYLDELAADTRVQRATQEWSSCMHDQGYEIADPDRASNYAADIDMDTADGRTRVHALAVADVDCFERFVIRQRVAAEREILLRWVESGKLPADLFTVR